MKRFTAIAFVALLAFYCAAVSVAVLSPLNPFGGGRWLSRGGDYGLRMAEIECLMKGVNPFDVWHGDVVTKPYVPLGGPAAGKFAGEDGFDELINAYPPWEYVMMMPFALLPRAIAWPLYFLGMMAGLLVVLAVGRRFCRLAAGLGPEAGLVVGVSSILFAGLPIYQNFHAGNFAVPVLVATALMAVCLNRGKDALAGVCWAFAMLKPQIGLAFAVPLLMLRRYKTCFVAAGICLALSVVPALMCHASPVDMIFQGARGSTYAFMGSGTFPCFLREFLPGDSGIIAGLLVGAIICAVMTRMLCASGARDHVVILMPAAVVGASWTYAQCFNYSMNWFFFVVLFASMAKWPKERFLWAIAALAAVFMTRLYNLTHMLPKVLPRVFPEFLPEESWHYHIDSFVSSVGIALTFAFCAWLARRLKCAQTHATQNKESA